MEKRRIEIMKTKLLIFTLVSIILTSMVACGSNNKIPEVVSTDYKPTISVPYCDQAKKDGTITGSTYLCMVSENGDPVGAGKTWVEQPPVMTFSSEPTLMFRVFNEVDISVDDPNLDDNWNLSFAPPRNQPWVVGNLYENPITSFGEDDTSPVLSISGNHIACSTVTGKFEILEVVDKSNPRQLDKFAANFEQHCDGVSAALIGYIRYNATVTP
jgi:hypothetical protein